MVRKTKLQQQTWANGVSAATNPTAPMHGRLEQIKVTINNNTGNRTLTLAIKDADGDTLLTIAAIPENATTVYTANSEKAVQDANFDALLLDEICTFTCTPSGDPGASGMTADISLYVTDGQI